jgi:hypothetical protein
MNIQGFLDAIIPIPEDAVAVGKWYCNRTRVVALMTSSIGPVQQEIYNAGWNDKSDQEPHFLYNLILKTISKKSEQNVLALIERFYLMQLEPGMTLHAFNTEMHKLITRLTQLECGFPEKAKIVKMMMSIKHRYPEWYRFLERDFNKGELTWKKLEEEVVMKSNAESVNQAGAFMARPTQRPSNTYFGNNSRGKIKCTLRGCKPSHPADWEHCKHCKRHHKGGEDNCWHLHPELREKWRQDQKKRNERPKTN